MCSPNIPEYLARIVSCNGICHVSKVWAIGFLCATFMFLPPKINSNSVVVAASFMNGDSSTSIHQDARQRFFDEYPKAYEILSSPFRNFVAKGHVKEELADIPDDAPGKASGDYDHASWKDVAKFSRITRDADFTFYIEGNSIQYEFCNAANSLDKHHPTKSVNCYTTSYCFILVKQAGRKEYVIIQHTDQEKNMGRAKLSTDVFAKNYAEAAFIMYGSPGNLLLNEKDCRIDSVRYVDASDGKLVAMEFTGLSKNFWYKRGHAVFDTSRNWAITEFELLEDFTEPYGRTIHCKVEYGDESSNSLVFPKKVDREMIYTTSGKAEQLRHEVATFTVAEPDAVPKGQFALSAYGLPDIPLKGPQSRLNIHLWIALSALIVLVLIFIWRQYRKKMILGK